jgi:hypothetical protein
MNDEQVEAAVRKVEEAEWHTVNRYLIRGKWSALTQKMKAAKAGGLAWRVLDKERDQVLLAYADGYFAGDLRAATLDLIRDVK